MLSYDLVILGSYAFLGAGIKYIDQAYDHGIFSRKKAKITAVLCGLLMSYLVVTDSPSTSIFLGMIAALIITKKVDNTGFYLGIAIVVAMPLAFSNLVRINWLPLTFLAVTGILDEIGNDWADRRMEKRDFGICANTDPPQYCFVEKFFTYRMAMKGAVLVLAFSSIVPWIYFIAFMLFDISYLLVDLYASDIRVPRISRAF
jgi:hypothetical protein